MGGFRQPLPNCVTAKRESMRLFEIDLFFFYSKTRMRPTKEVVKKSGIPNSGHIRQDIPGFYFPQCARVSVGPELDSPRTN